MLTMLLAVMLLLTRAAALLLLLLLRVMMLLLTAPVAAATTTGIWQRTRHLQGVRQDSTKFKQLATTWHTVTVPCGHLPRASCC
jgi:hypothetical protein